MAWHSEVLAALAEGRRSVLSTHTCLYLQFQGDPGPTPALTFTYRPPPNILTVKDNKDKPYKDSFAGGGTFPDWAGLM